MDRVDKKHLNPKEPTLFFVLPEDYLFTKSRSTLCTIPGLEKVVRQLRERIKIVFLIGDKQLFLSSFEGKSYPRHVEVTSNPGEGNSDMELRRGMGPMENKGIKPTARLSYLGDEKLVIGSYAEDKPKKQIREWCKKVRKNISKVYLIPSKKDKKHNNFSLKFGDNAIVVHPSETSVEGKSFEVMGETAFQILTNIAKVIPDGSDPMNSYHPRQQELISQINTVIEKIESKI